MWLSVLSVEKFAVSMRSEMRSPLLSCSDENHVGECAFASVKIRCVFWEACCRKKVCISVSIV